LNSTPNNPIPSTLDLTPYTEQVEAGKLELVTVDFDIRQVL
jgi:hypothetical protein